MTNSRTPAALRAVTFAIVGLTCVSLTALASDFTTLEERMTGAEFRDAGLHKLDDSELAALNRWIQERSLTELEPAAAPGPGQPAAEASDQTDTRGFLSGRPDAIETRIDGSFNGWDGPTRFRMTNGQVWETVGSGTFAIGEVENPRVTISPRVISGWQMRVEGYNRRVPVRRIE